MINSPEQPNVWKLRRATYDERREIARSSTMRTCAFVREFIGFDGLARLERARRRASCTRRKLAGLPAYEKDRVLETMLGANHDRQGWWGQAPVGGPGAGGVHFWLNVSRSNGAAVDVQVGAKQTVETVCGNHVLGRYDFDMRSDRIRKVYIDATTKRVCGYCAAIVMEQRA